MNIIEIAVIALLAAFCSLALKKYAPETAALLVIAAGILIFVTVLSKISPVIDQINLLISDAGMDSTYIPILVKTLGICLICQFTSDSCKDAGQASLASKVELASKVAVMITALPLFTNILHTAVGLMN